MKHALSKKLPFYFLGTILAPYDPEVLVWVIWHQPSTINNDNNNNNNININNNSSIPSTTTTDDDHQQQKRSLK